MTVGERIRGFRLNAGMTQRKAAGLVGINPVVWCHWEAGVNEPGTRSLRLIGIALNLTNDELGRIVRGAK
jgi:transcriptional regulator with XRE-family HTH domain